MSSLAKRELVRALREGRISRRQFVTRAIALGASMTLISAILQACGEDTDQVDAGDSSDDDGQTPDGDAQDSDDGESADTDGEPVELLFTYWGGPQERDDVAAMVDRFNESQSRIHVRAQHIPSADDNYTLRLTTMIAADTPPDVAYLGGAFAMNLAKEGQLLDLQPLLEADPDSGYLDTMFYRRGEEIIGSSIGEIMLLYYNKDLFDEVGVEYPGATPDEAYTWDEFVEVAKQLTLDRNGNNAASDDFNPNEVETYGVAFPQTHHSYLPLIWSNGGRFANDEGTELLLNQPEAVEVLQKMQDLIHVHHVAPTPSQMDALPATDVMMQSRRVAMDFNGHWKVLDYAQLDLDWSMSPLPYFIEPATMIQASARVIFAATEHPEEAFEFYKFHINPEQSELFKKGLWMPPQLEYYEDEEKISEWLEGEEGVYPPEARDVLIDYTLNNIPHPSPYYWLDNVQQILDEAVVPAMDLLWSGNVTAQEAADQAVEAAAPLMQGRVE